VEKSEAERMSYPSLLIQEYHRQVKDDSLLFTTYVYRTNISPYSKGKKNWLLTIKHATPSQHFESTELQTNAK